MNSAQVEYGEYLGFLFNLPSAHLCPDVTFQITSSCNLRCTYCYQHNKGGEVMTLNTGKEIVDLLLKQWQDDDPEAFISKYTKGLIMEFIGGEPMLYPVLIDEIIAYFIYRCEELNCPWLKYSRVNICTNGVNYNDKDVQYLIHKYKDMLSVNVTVDGPKEMHDACRVDAAGNGSFDKAFDALHSAKRFWGFANTKVTLVPETFPTLFETAKFMLDQGVAELRMNYAYEPYYSVDDAKILYEQLKMLSDYMINVKQNTYVTILNEECGKPLAPTDVQNFCGGNGKMLCFAPNGNAYPCVRFTETSLSKEMADKVILGHSSTGLYNTPETKATFDYLQSITRDSQSTEECLNCPVAKLCGWCTANNYEMLGDCNKRVTNICHAHKARTLASCYYFNKRYLELGDCEPKKMFLPLEDALNYISQEEYDELLRLEYAAFVKAFIRICKENPNFDWEGYLDNNAE